MCDMLQRLIITFGKIKKIYLVIFLQLSIMYFKNKT